MEDKAKRRQTIYEDAEKVKERSARRKSIFDNSKETDDRETHKKYMRDWYRRWGQYKIDYEDVVIFREDHVRTIEQEKNLWLEGINYITEKCKEFDLSEKTHVLENCTYPPDRIVYLKDIDDKIDGFLKSSETLLETIEATKNLHEMRLKEVNKEIEIVEKLIAFENKK